MRDDMARDFQSRRGLVYKLDGLAVDVLASWNFSICSDDITYPFKASYSIVLIDGDGFVFNDLSEVR